MFNRLRKSVEQSENKTIQESFEQIFGSFIKEGIDLSVQPMLLVVQILKLLMMIDDR